MFIYIPEIGEIVIFNGKRSFLKIYSFPLSLIDSFSAMV